MGGGGGGGGETRTACFSDSMRDVTHGLDLQRLDHRKTETSENEANVWGLGTTVQH